jgi:hypothetical protein
VLSVNRQPYLANREEPGTTFGHNHPQDLLLPLMFRQNTSTADNFPLAYRRVVKTYYYPVVHQSKTQNQPDKVFSLELQQHNAFI